jgi:hypothetical protein
METFPSRSWSWFNEERIWKPFLQDHDHDLIKNVYVLHWIMIMILKEQFPYSFFITSWSWSWRKGLHICSSLHHDHDLVGNVSIYILQIMIMWSWFNEERIWKLFLQVHDHDLVKNDYGIFSFKIMIIIQWKTYLETFPSRTWSWWTWSWRKCSYIRSLLYHDHDHEGKISIYVLHWVMIMILKEQFPYSFFITQLCHS